MLNRFDDPGFRRWGTTRRDILIKVLSQRCKKTEKAARAFLAVAERKLPIGEKIDAELTPEKAESLFNFLLQDESGIMRLLLRLFSDFDSEQPCEYASAEDNTAME